MLLKTNINRTHNHSFLEMIKTRATLNLILVFFLKKPPQFYFEVAQQGTTALHSKFFDSQLQGDLSF